MSPQTSAELFDAAGAIAKQIADLVVSGWVIGIRDGLHTAASSLDRTVESNPELITPQVAALLATVSTSLRLSALQVEVPTWADGE